MSQHSATWVHMSTGRTRASQFCRLPSQLLSILLLLALLYAGEGLLCWNSNCHGQGMGRSGQIQCAKSTLGCHCCLPVLFPGICPHPLHHVKLSYMLGRISDLVFRGDAGAGSLGLDQGSLFCGQHLFLREGGHRERSRSSSQLGMQ